MQTIPSSASREPLASRVTTRTRSAIRPRDGKPQTRPSRPAPRPRLSRRPLAAPRARITRIIARIARVDAFTYSVRSHLSRLEKAERARARARSIASPRVSVCPITSTPFSYSVPCFPVYGLCPHAVIAPSLRSDLEAHVAIRPRSTA